MKYLLNDCTEKMGKEMKSMTKFITILITAILITSCSSNKPLKITPMYEDINDSMGFNAQYFEIENYHNYPDDVLMDKIAEFSQKTSPNKLIFHKIFKQFFYKKTLLGKCKDRLKIIEAAREGEYGTIEGCNNQLISRVYLINNTSAKENDNLDINRFIVVYKNNTYNTRDDSLKIENGKWNMITKGKIEVGESFR